jgi:putative ABC transport system substrate-binding protein
VPVKARVRFIRQLMPRAKTFGLIYADMPQSRSYNAWLRELLEKDSQFKDIRILFRPIPLVTGEDGDQRMAEQAIPFIQELDGQVDAFIKPNDQLGTREQFSRVVAKHASKPLIGIVKSDVVDGWGASAVIYPSHTSIGQQAASMIRDLFEGKPVRSIPPQWPTLYGYAVDLAKTRRFGISVPVGILQLAGENIVR